MGTLTTTLHPNAYFGKFDESERSGVETDFVLIYSDHVPVDLWQILPCETFEVAAEVASRRADKDLKPDSGVYDNLFFILRWDGESWDYYDENGDDYADIVFGDVEEVEV